MTRLLTMIVAVAAFGRLVAADETIVSAPEPASTAQATTDFGSYSYDGAGNITAVGEDTFTYDAFGRITTAAVRLGSATQTQTFTYDRYGNIRKITTTSQPDYVPAVDERTNRTDLPTSGTNAVAQYDAAGNAILVNGSDRFVYDPLDVVTESTVGVERNVYLYNASNERIATLKVAGSAVTSSKWTLRDASAKVLRRLSKDASGTWRWDEDYIYRGTQLLAAEIPGNTLHFHPDHLGTPRVITGRGGARLSEHKYYPFGAELTSPGTEVMKFTGHEREAPNLDYMHARYYIPYGGRFLSVDPVLNVEKALREPQSWNRYSYVTNNPLKFTDPDGREKTIYFLGGLLHRWTAYEEVSDLRGFVKSQAGYSLNVDSQMSRSEVLGGLSNLDSTDIAVVNAHSWDLNLQTERGATGRETFTANSIVSAFNRGGNPQALVLAGCRSADIAQLVANKTGVVTFGTTARTQSREVGFAATVLATIYAKTGNAAMAVKVANSILSKGGCPRDNPGCTPERPQFVYYEPEKKK